MPMPLQKLLRLVAATALVLAVAGCFGDEIWASNPASQPRLGTGRMIFALDSSRGPLSASLMRGTDNPCAPQASAQSPQGATGVNYFAFDVLPGTYSVGGLDFLRAGDPNEFVIPAHGAVYIGKFINDPRVSGAFDAPQAGIHIARDDLSAAQAALGLHGSDLELAEVVSGGHHPSLCERLP